MVLRLLLVAVAEEVTAVDMVGTEEGEVEITIVGEAGAMKGVIRAVAMMGVEVVITIAEEAGEAEAGLTVVKAETKEVTARLRRLQPRRMAAGIIRLPSIATEGMPAMERTRCLLRRATLAGPRLTLRLMVVLRVAMVGMLVVGEVEAEVAAVGIALVIEVGIVRRHLRSRRRK